MGYEFIIAGTGAELRLRVIEERERGGALEEIGGVYSSVYSKESR